MRQLESPRIDINTVPDYVRTRLAAETMQFYLRLLSRPDGRKMIEEQKLKKKGDT